MELKKIKELMTAMGRTGIKRLAIKDGKFEIELEREGAVVTRVEEPYSVVHVAAHSPKKDIPPSLIPVLLVKTSLRLQVRRPNNVR